MLLVFDVDGTIIDNIQVFVSCINGILNQHGFPSFPQEHITSVIGWGPHTRVNCAKFSIRNFGCRWILAEEGYLGVIIFLLDWCK